MINYYPNPDIEVRLIVQVIVFSLFVLGFYIEKNHHNTNITGDQYL